MCRIVFGHLTSKQASEWLILNFKNSGNRNNAIVLLIETNISEKMCNNDTATNKSLHQNTECSFIPSVLATSLHIPISSHLRTQNQTKNEMCNVNISGVKFANIMFSCRRLHLYFYLNMSFSQSVINQIWEQIGNLGGYLHFKWWHIFTEQPKYFLC